MSVAEATKTDRYFRTTLGSLVEEGEGFIQTGPFGSQLHARDYVHEGVPVVMPQQLGDNEVTRDGIAQIRERDRDRLSRHIMREGDIVFSRRGDVTRRAYVSRDEDGWMCGTGCLLVRLNHPRCNTRYLARFFGTHEIKNYLIQHAVGATMPNLNQGILASVPVRLPSVQEQDDVVDILSAYDELIENNRRRIELLEQSARLLYKEWFVYLRFPGHEHTTITNGIPEGWDEGKVADFYKTASGGTPSRKKPEYYVGEIQWVKTKELPNGFILETEEHINEEGLNSSSAKLFPKDTLLLALYGATIGELGILANEASTNQACCAIMPNDGRANIFHSYLFFRENKINLVSLSGGAAQNNISQQIVRGFPMCMPSVTVMNLFLEKLAPVFDEWLNLERQNRRLIKARDLLLPRLMNGEIAV